MSLCQVVVTHCKQPDLQLNPVCLAGSGSSKAANCWRKSGAHCLSPVTLTSVSLSAPSTSDVAAKLDSRTFKKKCDLGKLWLFDSIHILVLAGKNKQDAEHKLI